MNSSNYESCILEYKIHAEYQLLLSHKIPDLYVIPSASSSFIWYGVIFIHHGFYEGAIFRFTIFIPDNLSECPRVIFNPIRVLFSVVYHPLINIESGELDVKQYIKNWKLNIHHIYHVLYYLRSIFYQIDTKNCLHQNAAFLYENDKNAFIINVKKCIENSNSKIYDNPPINSDDPHAIRFAHLNDESFKLIKQAMQDSI